MELNRFDEADLVNDAHNSRGRLLRNLETGIEIHGFSFGWLSFGYKIQNDAFKLFTTSSAYDSQIVKTDYLSHEFRFQYSYYKYAKAAFESYYWDVGIAPKIINNLSELEKIEVAESELAGSAAGQRSITAKYDAYKGEYKENIWGTSTICRCILFFVQRQFSSDPYLSTGRY